ncbi:MAG: hypothetical protein U1D06_03000 [Paracoccaceae bacterium]|nr:hypothetical protein [Paracoccaceae bacterium]
MTHKLFALSLGFAALILMAHAGNAAQCGPRGPILAQLAERFGETRRSVGLADNNMVIEVFASAKTQSWTITVTTPDGNTCLVAAGLGFETLAEPLPAKGDPA